MSKGKKVPPIKHIFLGSHSNWSDSSGWSSTKPLKEKMKVVDKVLPLKPRRSK